MNDMENKFCTQCGAELISGACPKCSQARQVDNAEKFKQFFMNPKENFVCSLGNGYIQNFLANGSVGNGFAVVSDKRVYFNGKTYEVHNSRLKATSESRTVDLKDVTGTGVRAIKYPLLWILAIVTAVLAVVITTIVTFNIGNAYSNGFYDNRQAAEELANLAEAILYSLFGLFPILFLPSGAFYLSYHLSRKKGLLITALILTAVGFVWLIVLNIVIWETLKAVFVDILIFVPAAALLFSYFKTRKTILTISYAGGCIAFDINWYSKEESEGFQKMLRIAKDKAVEDVENATANAMREVMSNVVGTPVQPVQSVQPQTPVSTADELMKYAQLYKDGLLSEEEFAAIKAKML